MRRRRNTFLVWLLAVLTAVAASGKPLMGALAMLALGLGQGSVLAAAYFAWQALLGT